MSTPPTTSLWPLMYLVVEWVTMSMPQSSGCCRIGVAKVPSQTVTTFGSGLARQLRDSGEVGDLHQRVGGRLGPDEARVRGAGPRARRPGSVIST